MAQSRDKLGRPIVAVTGMGIVTSLGAGKVDNWASLEAGKSGIRAITRFPTDGLKTRVAGTIDFIKLDDTSAPAFAERLAEIAIEEAITHGSSESGNEGTSAPSKPEISAARATSSM